MLLNNIKQFLICCRTDKWHATSIPISTPNTDRTWQPNKKRSCFVFGTFRILFSERRKHRSSFVEIHSLRTPFSVSDVKSGPSKILLNFQGLADNYVCGFCKCALWDYAHFQRSEGITSLCPGITIDIENLTEQTLHSLIYSWFNFLYAYLFASISFVASTSFTQW
jgi:hypothetical protein